MYSYGISTAQADQIYQVYTTCHDAKYVDTDQLVYLFYRHKSRQTTSTYQVAGTWYVVLVLCKTYPVECYTTIVLMDAVFLHQVQYLYLYNWKDVGDDMRWHGVRVCRCHAPLSHCLTFHNTTNHILPPNSITTWYVQVFILGCSSVHFILC